VISDLISRSTAPELKHGPQHFTRGGPLTPELLITLLLYLVADGGRRGYALLLDSFWDKARDQNIPLPTDLPVSAAAFCKARRKLKPAALRSILHRVSDAFEHAHGPHHRFKGRRVFAVDGSKFSLQRSPDLWDAFGGPKCGHCPQILVTTLFDVVAKVPHDVSIAPFASSEPAQLRHLLDRLAPGDVLVLDRGYPSYDLIETLLEHRIDFVIRVPTTKGFKAIETFLDLREVMTTAFCCELLPISRISRRSKCAPFAAKAAMEKTGSSSPASGARRSPEGRS